MEELFKKLFNAKKNSHVYITKYKITSLLLFFLRNVRELLLFIYIYK